ncbi:hypothetical protein [Halosimplex halophilum]|uniref:hypothetical protein n=1 Tax=Halosimplex halophilum TaxID=2559572 RepID=UPI001435460B|nr:hypothetical protein [Halosimplex halophilum]
MTEITNTDYLHNSRPFIVRAIGQTDDGRRVEGLGASYLTRGRATDKAIADAERNAEEFDVGFQILNVDHRKTAIALKEDEFDIQKRRLAFPPYKVRISAYRGEKSVDASSSGWLRFSGTVASAVQNAQARLGTFD